MKPREQELAYSELKAAIAGARPSLALSGGQSGQSLVQVLVAIGIMAILASGFASMLVNQQRETRALSEKLGAMDLEKIVIASLADGSVCHYVLNNPSVMTFNSTRRLPQTLTLTNPSPSTAALYASAPGSGGGPPGAIVAQVNQTASPVSPQLRIQSIQLEITGGPPGGGSGTYTGNWLVNFDANSAVRPIKPVSAKTLLIVDGTVPTAAKFVGCQGGGGGGSGGGPTPIVTNDPGGRTCGATCPNAKNLIGGGCSADPSGVIYKSYPNGKTWRCETHPYIAFGSTGTGLSCFALCN